MFRLIFATGTILIIVSALISFVRRRRRAAAAAAEARNGPADGRRANVRAGTGARTGTRSAGKAGNFFISYRRDDAAPYAGRVYDHLSNHFGPERLFMDIDTIGPGDDFVQAISDRVASCDVLIALIGKHWLAVTDSRGRRRLEDPNDFVRIEISSALARNVRVIPALVDGATMPLASDLPSDLASACAQKRD